MISWRQCVKVTRGMRLNPESCVVSSEEMGTQLLKPRSVQGVQGFSVLKCLKLGCLHCNFQSLITSQSGCSWELNLSSTLKINFWVWSSASTLAAEDTSLFICYPIFVLNKQQQQVKPKKVTLSSDVSGRRVWVIPTSLPYRPVKMLTNTGNTMGSREGR